MASCPLFWTIDDVETAPVFPVSKLFGSGRRSASDRTYMAQTYGQCAWGLTVQLAYPKYLEAPHENLKNCKLAGHPSIDLRIVTVVDPQLTDDAPNT